MALVYTRLLCRRNVDFRQFRCLYTSSLRNTSSPGSTVQICETHDERNMRLGRPMSPHLSIYQVQLTTMLSITHRATGIILSGYAMFLGLGSLFIAGGIPCVIETIEDWCLPLPVVIAGKILLALPATFHLFNGIRHLLWDLGLFLTIKEVYTTGYIVSALSIAAAVALALM